MLSAVLAQTLQSVLVLAGAPLYAGVLARAEAIVESKPGPGVLQGLPTSGQAAAQG